MFKKIKSRIKQFLLKIFNKNKKIQKVDQSRKVVGRIENSGKNKKIPIGRIKNKEAVAKLGKINRINTKLTTEELEKRKNKSDDDVDVFVLEDNSEVYTDEVKKYFKF